MQNYKKIVNCEWKKCIIQKLFITLQKHIGIKDKMQVINGTILIISAIALYFVSFILTMTIGMGVISAGGTMLASGLAFFGIMAYVKTEITEFKNQVLSKEKEE